MFAFVTKKSLFLGAGNSALESGSGRQVVTRGASFGDVAEQGAIG